MKHITLKSNGQHGVEVSKGLIRFEDGSFQWVKPSEIKSRSLLSLSESFEMRWDTQKKTLLLKEGESSRAQLKRRIQNEPKN